MILLEDRSLLEITGPEQKKFLQGLVTNDVYKASESRLIYAAMLNAQGRFLYDFFIFDVGEKLMLDCFAPRRDEIIQKLNLYKLRAQVEIKKNDELKVLSTVSDTKVSDTFFPDPRNPGLGHRLYSPNYQLPPTTYRLEYDMGRILLKIPESEHDLTYEKSLILEFGFDELNAIDYNKGCYVGQELTARTHHLGEIRKKVFHVKIAAEKVEKNSEIDCTGKSVGIILSSVLHKGELHALSLIKHPQEVDLNNLKTAGQKISVIN